MKIMHVVGARPNFMKIAPILREMAKQPTEFEQVLVHTGQHYDANMSRIFFDELDLPEPDINLEVGSGSHAWQTAQVMLRFEPLVQEFHPDWIVVPGDVNSTLACALVGSKLDVKVAHVEAGLRSFDHTMPEEINRLLTDQISDLLFTPSPDADENLLKEGIPKEKICFVGNVMIDTLVRLLPRAELHWHKLRAEIGLDHYVLVTLHRPSNVDNPEILKNIVVALEEISREISVLFPIHPRTRRRLEEYEIQTTALNNLYLVEPFGYLKFLALQKNAALVVTDSGGIQEETTFLNVPCLTLRPNTERPITVRHGTNQLVETCSVNEILQAIFSVLEDQNQKKVKIPYWDGQTANRIVQTFLQY
jgi:UDP-N-acetylglucosamine 2-epimerase (non-hydrolysing)